MLRKRLLILPRDGSESTTEAFNTSSNVERLGCHSHLKGSYIFIKIRHAVADTPLADTVELLNLVQQACCKLIELCFCLIMLREYEYQKFFSAPLARWLERTSSISFFILIAYPPRVIASDGEGIMT